MNNNKEDIIKYYTREAEIYEFRRFENPKYPANLRLKRKIIEVCKKYLVDNTLFEIACGTGYWEKIFTDMGYQYSGVDLTPTMIEKAKARGIADYRVGDVEDISVYPKEVDNIVCIKSFTMFQNQQQVLNNIYQSLRPGGRLLIFYNNKWNLLPLIASLFKGGRRGLGLSSSYDEPISRGQFLGMLEKSGLKLILIKECCNIPYRFLPRWRWLDKIDDLLAFGWITYVVAEKEKCT